MPADLEGILWARNHLSVAGFICLLTHGQDLEAGHLDVNVPGTGTNCVYLAVPSSFWFLTVWGAASIWSLIILQGMLQEIRGFGSYLVGERLGRRHSHCLLIFSPHSVYCTIRFKVSSSELLDLSIVSLIRELRYLFNHCVSQDNTVVSFQEALEIVMQELPRQFERNESWQPNIGSAQEVARQQERNQTSPRIKL